MQVDPAAREAKLEAVHEKLTNAVTALVTGEDWRRALEFAAQFRSRSFNNTLLIYTQHFAAYEEGRVPEPTPSYVAGFKQWLTLGRHVEKGQSGYQILAPVTARFASSTPAGRRVMASSRARRAARACGDGPVPHDRAAPGIRLGRVTDERRPDSRASPTAAAAGSGARWTVGWPGSTGGVARLRAPTGSPCSSDRRGERTDRLSRPRGVGPDGHGSRGAGQDAGSRARARDAARPRQRRRRDCTAGSRRSKPRASPS